MFQNLRFFIFYYKRSDPFFFSKKKHDPKYRKKTRMWKRDQGDQVVDATEHK